MHPWSEQRTMDSDQSLNDQMRSGEGTQQLILEVAKTAGGIYNPALIDSEEENTALLVPLKGEFAPCLRHRTESKPYIQISLNTGNAIHWSQTSQVSPMCPLKSKGILPLNTLESEFSLCTYLSTITLIISPHTSEVGKYYSHFC
ncbi:unnamed protein product [Lepidochelys kempii]